MDEETKEILRAICTELRAIREALPTKEEYLRFQVFQAAAVLDHDRSRAVEHAFKLYKEIRNTL